MPSPLLDSHANLSPNSERRFAPKNGNEHSNLDIQFEIDTDVGRIEPVVRYVDERLRLTTSFSERDLIQIGGALAEAISNAIYYGNLELSAALCEADEAQFDCLAEQRSNQTPYSDRKVKVRVFIQWNQVTLVIRDEGAGFDVTAVPDPTADDNLFRITGRGLFLIRHYMDRVSHNPQGNEITMTKTLRTSEPASIDLPNDHDWDSLNDTAVELDVQH